MMTVCSLLGAKNEFVASLISHFALCAAEVHFSRSTFVSALLTFTVHCREGKSYTTKKDSRLLPQPGSLLKFPRAPREPKQGSLKQETS